MNEPLFSIVIPLYNKARYVREAVDSVLSQSVSDLELIVVDDGSTDGGGELLRGVSDSRLRLIRQENAGVSAARNRGIREAKGKYIAFLDADDLWAPDFLKVSQELFERFPLSGMVCPSYEVRYAKRSVVPRWRSVDPEGDSYVEDFYEMATAPFWICSSSCAVIDSGVLAGMDRLFPENETVYEDLDLWLRIGAGHKVSHSSRVCAVYRRNSEGNARRSHEGKVVYSASFMSTIDELSRAPSATQRRREWLEMIKDRRMVPYIFSLLLAGRRDEAKRVIAGWTPCGEYKKYRSALSVLSVFPIPMLKMVQSLRLRIF